MNVINWNELYPQFDKEVLDSIWSSCNFDFDRMMYSLEQLCQEENKSEKSGNCVFSTSDLFDESNRSAEKAKEKEMGVYKRSGNAKIVFASRKYRKIEFLFNRLPMEVMNVVFGFFTLFEQARIARVSSEFYEYF